MAKHKLTYWERNGYHDSDFYVSYWDDAAQAVAHEQVGSTAYASGTNISAEFQYPTPDVVEKAIAWLENWLFSALKSAELRDVLEPSHIRAGERGCRLRLTAEGKFKDKKTGVETEFAVGDAGVVVWSGQFGTFYSKGFNVRGRHNTRVGIKLDKGGVVFVDLAKCRLDKEPLSDEELRERARQLAPGCQFSKCFGAAWDTENYALQVLKTAKAAV